MSGGRCGRGTTCYDWLVRVAFLLGVLAASTAVAEPAENDEPAESEASKEDEQSDEGEPGHGMPIVSLRSNYYGFAELQNPMPGTFEEDLEGSMLLTSFKGIVPIPFADQTIILVPGVFFEHTHLEYRGWDFDVTPREEQLSDFYATGVEMTMINELSDRFWFASRLTWGLYSDLKEIDGSDARLYGILTGEWLVMKNMIVGLGLSYNSDFGFPAPIPFVRFAYKNDWFRTDITIPSDAQAFFMPHERIEVGARARLLGNEYRMTYENDAWNDMLVQLSTIEVGGVAAVRTFKGLWLEIGGGTTLNNRYKAVLPDGSVLREIDFAPTWFANAALIYRI